MEKTLRYTLGKTERLKSRKTIEGLFKNGKSVSVPPLRMVWKMTAAETGSVQAGFSVGTKHFKKAVDRNRVKRLMREAYRLQKNHLAAALLLKPQELVLFIIFTGKEVPDYKLIFEKTGLALNKLIKLVHET